MTPKYYRIILHRELDKLQAELTKYEQEEDIWKLYPGIQNSAGNLAIHLLGNLKHYVGAEIGQTGYERDKPSEFQVKGISREEIYAEIEEVKKLTKDILDNLSSEVLEGDFIDRLEDKVYPTELILHHIMAHFTYHLGQINYHRRLLVNFSQ